MSNRLGIIFAIKKLKPSVMNIMPLARGLRLAGKPTHLSSNNKLEAKQKEQKGYSLTTGTYYSRNETDAGNSVRSLSSPENPD